MIVIRALALVGVTASLLYYLAAVLAALRFKRDVPAKPHALPKIAPRIAVLKPLRGQSASLVDNLTGYLENDYPRAEFYFAVADYEDPAAAVVAGLRAHYHFASITLLVGDQPDCVNSKVGKLIRMAERAARAEIFVLSDADIAVSRDHLHQLVSELSAEDDIGVVTCLYRAEAIGSLASRLDALCVNTDFVPQVMISAAIEPVRYALGATIAVKRSALDKIGGFNRLKDLLADDYYLGKFAADAGYRVRLSHSIVTTHCEERWLADFWRHQLRWARTYRTVRPASLATIIVHGPSWAVLLLLASGFSLHAGLVLCVVLAARIAMARFVIGQVLGLRDHVAESWLVPLKDLIMTAIWFGSLAGSQVQWGGRRYQILPGGAMRQTHE